MHRHGPPQARAAQRAAAPRCLARQATRRAAPAALPCCGHPPCRTAIPPLCAQQLGRLVLGSPMHVQSMFPGAAGVDCILDPVGGALLMESLKAARWGAHILVIGFASGAFALWVWRVRRVALCGGTSPYLLHAGFEMPHAARGMEGRRCGPCVPGAAATPLCALPPAQCSTATTSTTSTCCMCGCAGTIPKLPANLLLVKNLTAHGIYWCAPAWLSREAQLSWEAQQKPAASTQRRCASARCSAARPQPPPPPCPV